MRDRAPAAERGAPSGIGALRIDDHGRAHFYRVRLLTADRVRRFVALTDRGLTRPALANDDCYAVLDLYSTDGDIVEDRAVPTQAAWMALNSELQLEVETVE